MGARVVCLRALSSPADREGFFKGDSAGVAMMLLWARLLRVEVRGERRKCESAEGAPGDGVLSRFRALMRADLRGE